MPVSLSELAYPAIVFSMLLVCSLLARRNSANQQAFERLDGVVEAFAIEKFTEGQGFRHVKPVTVLIPAFNEMENLKHVLPRMPKSVCGQDLGVVVINDGSTDGTGDLATMFDIAVASTLASRGQGSALRLGYRLALKGGAKIIVTMDADGQNRPEEIEKLVVPVLAGQSDFVIGSRLLGKIEVDDDPVRLLGMQVLSPLASLITRTRITDCSSGFRAMKATVMDKIINRLKQRQFATAELNVEVAKNGFKITEVPISFLKRISGSSKKGNNLFYGLGFAKSIFVTWLRA